MRASKSTVLIALAAIAAGNFAAHARVTSLSELADLLDSNQRFAAAASYAVSLPNYDDDIVYHIDMQSMASKTDRLSPCNYLIEWSMATPSGKSEGFSAYSNGSHYRYRDERLQEYHFDWDSIAFVGQGGGVQRNAQFVELLPQYLAERLRAIATDSAYTVVFKPDIVVGGRHVASLKATEERQGFVGSILSATFDPTTGMPLSMETENNPGSITEQTVTVKYLAPDVAPIALFSEECLIERHPEVFERFRRSNFRVENLPGTFVPSFSLPTLTGERYSHVRREAFAAPTVIAVIDPGVDTARSTIETLRSTLDMMPFNVEIIWAFSSNNIDEIEEIVGEARPGEHVLMSARSLMRDCGISVTPTLIFAKRTSQIEGVQLGYNKNLSEIVMQKTMMLID